MTRRDEEIKVYGQFDNLRRSLCLSFLEMSIEQHPPTAAVSLSLNLHHLKFILLYVLRALGHCVVLCSPGQHADGGREVHCWGVVGREGRSTRGDWGHMPRFLSILPQTISCFPNLLKVLKQDIERTSENRQGVHVPLAVCFAQNHSSTTSGQDGINELFLWEVKTKGKNSIKNFKKK